MACSFAGHKSDDVFLSGHLKEYGCAVLPRPIEDLVARLQAAVPTADANCYGMFERMAHYRLS